MRLKSLDEEWLDYMIAELEILALKYDADLSFQVDKATYTDLVTMVAALSAFKLVKGRLVTESQEGVFN